MYFFWPLLCHTKEEVFDSAHQAVKKHQEKIEESKEAFPNASADTFPVVRGDSNWVHISRKAWDCSFFDLVFLSELNIGIELCNVIVLFAWRFDAHLKEMCYKNCYIVSVWPLLHIFYVKQAAVHLIPCSEYSTSVLVKSSLASTTQITSTKNQGDSYHLLAG